MQLSNAFFCMIKINIYLFTSFTIAADELINTTCCINKFALTCIERVRCA